MTLAAPAAPWATALRRQQRGFVAICGFAALLLATFVLAVGRGAVDIPPGDVLAILAHAAGLDTGDAVSPAEETVLLAIRLPRACLAVLVGGGLAVAGASLQGLFRNPLADPALIGVSTGAALAAVAVIVLGGAVVTALPAALRGFALPVAAFAGGLAATLIVFRIASRDGLTDVATMLLAGVALNAMTGAGIGLMVFVSEEQQLRDLSFWMLGSLGGVTWDRRCRCSCWPSVRCPCSRDRSTRCCSARPKPRISDSTWSAPSVGSSCWPRSPPARRSL